MSGEFEEIKTGLKEAADFMDEIIQSCGCVYKDLDVPCKKPECEICENEKQMTHHNGFKKIEEALHEATEEIDYWFPEVMSEEPEPAGWVRCRDSLRQALAVLSALKEAVPEWALKQYEDWRDTDQVIDRHNEDGIEELATAMYELIGGDDV